MWKTFTIVIGLSLSLSSIAEFSQSPYRWIAVFNPDFVESCNDEYLFEKLNDLASANLSLIRPFNNCGIILVSDKPLDIKALEKNPSIRYIEQDGVNQPLPVPPPIE